MHREIFAGGLFLLYLQFLLNPELHTPRSSNVMVTGVLVGCTLPATAHIKDTANKLVLIKWRKFDPMKITLTTVFKLD